MKNARLPKRIETVDQLLDAMGGISPVLPPGIDHLAPVARMIVDHGAEITDFCFSYKDKSGHCQSLCSSNIKELFLLVDVTRTILIKAMTGD